MKHFNKMMIFFLFILASFARDISAHRYTITNLTGTDVKIELFFTPFPSIKATIKPYDTKIFSSGGIKTIACLTKIMCSPFNEEMNRYLGSIKADIRELTESQFKIAKAAIKEFVEAFRLGTHVVEGVLNPKLLVASKVLEGLADLATGATALGGGLVYVEIVIFCLF